MSNINDIAYRGEEVTINGKKTIIVFALKGMKVLAQEFGTVYKGLTQMQSFNMELDAETLDKVAILLYAGLIQHNPELTKDEVEELLTFDKIPYLLEKLTTVMMNSLPQVEGKNPKPNPAK